MRIRRSLLKDTAQVSTYRGESAYGPTHDIPLTVRCNVDARRRLARSPGGDEVVADITLQVHPDDEALFTTESRVTVRGRDAQVLSVATHTLRGRPVYVEVVCG